MASTHSAKGSYLDGVPFDLNPIFIPDEPTAEYDDYQLRYDLSKANSILNCKYDFEVESQVLFPETQQSVALTQYDDEHDDAKNQLSMYTVNRKHHLQSDSCEQCDTKVNHVTILKLLNDFTTSGVNTTATTNHTSPQQSIPTSVSPSSSSSLVTSVLPQADLTDSHLALSYPNQSTKWHLLEPTSANQPSPQQSLPTSVTPPSVTVSSTFSHVISSSLPQVSSSDTRVASSVYQPPTKWELLQPVRSTDDASAKRLRETTSNSNKQHTRATSVDLFNVMSSSLDPFNDMELQTINDIEELKTVLEQQQLQIRQGQLEQTQQQLASSDSMLTNQSNSTVLAQSCDTITSSSNNKRLFNQDELDQQHRPQNHHDWPKPHENVKYQLKELSNNSQSANTPTSTDASSQNVKPFVRDSSNLLDTNSNGLSNIKMNDFFDSLN